MIVFLDLFLFLLSLIIGYFLLVYIVALFCGCYFQEAEKKVHYFFNGSVELSVFNNENLTADIEYTVKNVLGERQYKNLVGKNSPYNKKSLLYYERSGAFPYLIISVPNDIENEKAALENNICNTLLHYLSTYGHSHDIVPEWGFRDDLGLLTLRIGFSTNKKQHQALLDYMNDVSRTKKNTNGAVIDDTEEEDLND